MLSAATKMRPLAAIGAVKRRAPGIGVAPPAKMVAPVSPSKPCRSSFPSAPTTQTIASERPSVVVTMGDPPPVAAVHQEPPNVGGEPGMILSVERSVPALPPVQDSPAPR